MEFRTAVLSLFVLPLTLLTAEAKLVDLGTWHAYTGYVTTGDTLAVQIDDQTREVFVTLSWPSEEKPGTRESFQGKGRCDLPANGKFDPRASFECEATLDDAAKTGLYLDAYISPRACITAQVKKAGPRPSAWKGVFYCQFSGE